MSDFFFNNLLFLILLSAHLTGDFILQTDGIFRLRYKNLFGEIIHALLNTITVFIFILFAYYNIQYAIIISIVIFITHFIIDHIKKKINIFNVLVFSLDQLLHIIIIVLISIKFDNRIIIKNNFLMDFRFVYFYIVLILNTLFIRYFNNSIFNLSNIFYNHKFIIKYIGDIERSIIFIFAYMHGFFFMLIPFVLMPRLIYSIKTCKEFILFDIFISMVLSSGLGILLRKITINNPFYINTLLLCVSIFFLIILGIDFLSFIIFKKNRFLLDKISN